MPASPSTGSRSGGLCWPCPDQVHPGTPILHVGQFTRGLGKFFPVAYQPPAEEADEEYPLTLTTGRMLEHYHTGTMTRRSDGLNELVPTGFVEVHPDDAEALGVADGDVVVVETRRGRIDVPAHVTRARAAGHGVHPVPLLGVPGQPAHQHGARPAGEDPRVQGLRLPHRRLA